MSLKECIRHMKFICEQGVLRNKSIILNKTFQRELLNIIKHYEELEEENFNLRENIYIEKKSFPSDGRNIEELIEMPTYEELQQENQKYKEVIDKAIEIIKDYIPEEYIRSCDTEDGIGRYELDTESWQYRVYEILKEVK